MHVARNVIHFGGQTGWLYGVAILPLAEVFAIEFTAPIWTAILATVILGERLSRYRMLAIVLGFAGIVIILRPGIAAIQPKATSSDPARTSRAAWGCPCRPRLRCGR